MPHLPDEETIYDVVAGGLGEVGRWIKRYHELTLLTDYSVPNAIETFFKRSNAMLFCLLSNYNR
jgi:hypothetical protein